jgi:predicted metal-dependent phosphoesterase TrpH
LFSKVDLHTHTIASDGTFTPRELVETAARRGLRVLAITDHDSTEGIAEALTTARSTHLELWPGVEISTDVPGGEVHILGYMIDHLDRVLQETLRKLRESRLGRARRMVDKLGALGMRVSWERVQEIAGAGAVGRPHVAQAMLEQGYVDSIAEAFNRYIGRNGPAYVERYRLTPEEAVQLIVRAKGLASLAHPVNVGPTSDTGEQLDLEALLPRLVPAGLAGIEVYYAGYTPEITKRLLQYAARWSLMGTGGSDFHGRGALTIGVGEVPVPESVIEQVRERHARQLKDQADPGDSLRRTA